MDPFNRKEGSPGLPDQIYLQTRNDNFVYWNFVSFTQTNLASVVKIYSAVNSMARL
jgi:hypothetical protein